MAVVLCPRCGAENTGQMGIGGEWTPVSGDLAICAGCCQVNVFVMVEGMMLQRLPNGGEQAAIDAMPELQGILEFLRKAKGEQPWKK